MKNTLYKVMVLLFLVAVCSNCTSETEKQVDKTNKLLDNGMRLVVEKTNETTKEIGIFSKHNYRTTHSYTYKFTVDGGDVNWDGGSGEPKHILFCENSVYVHYLKEKYISVQRDTTSTEINNNGYNMVEEVFELYIDNRYFFKLFGDDYWVEITPESYANKKTSCDEYNIPNDNELSLVQLGKEG
ncbi:hypothetical protein [Aquimarina algiphila]|uniref:hypothetical protein n=1 Tax=Aquimarina algiphila TaxID=2047982 RepID=UPI00232EF110|nr:hypothetical protein [Aquimarina algiphila]